jgi:hypothetical protein
MRERTMILTGRALTGIFAVFMLAASIAPKFLGAKATTDTLIQLGWPGDAALMIGVIELSCLILYLLPRTSLLGAVLMTGLLGGAMATQVRVDNPLFSHIFFSLYLGLFMWGGLWLRTPSLRRLFPIRTEDRAQPD